MQPVLKIYKSFGNDVIWSSNFQKSSIGCLVSSGFIVKMASDDIHSRPQCITAIRNSIGKFEFEQQGMEFANSEYRN